KATPAGDFELDALLDAWVIAYTKEAMLREKIKLLDFIEKNEYQTNGFLQGDPVSVQDWLERLGVDAQERVKEKNEFAKQWANDWFSLDAKLWYGLKGDKKVEWPKERLYRAVTGEASIALGIQASADMTLEVKGLKGKLSLAGRAGLFGEVKGKAEIGKKAGGARVEGEVNVEIGITLKIDASLDAYDFFEAGFSGSAFAGAMGNAKAGVSITKDGVKMELTAEGFAGVKAEGSASAKLKW